MPAFAAGPRVLPNTGTTREDACAIIIQEIGVWMVDVKGIVRSHLDRILLDFVAGGRSLPGVTVPFS